MKLTPLPLAAALGLAACTGADGKSDSGDVTPPMVPPDTGTYVVPPMPPPDHSAYIGTPTVHTGDVTPPMVPPSHTGGSGSVAAQAPVVPVTPSLSPLPGTRTSP